MQLVEQHVVKTTKELDDICFASKNLYNRCLYLTRQYFFETQKYIGYKRLYEQIKTEDCYRVLPIKVSQLVVKQMQDDFVSFFKATAEYKINPSKFLGRPKIPHYKDKENGRNIVKYNNQAFSKRLLKEHIINPSGTTFKIKTNKENINEVRIIPHSGFTCIEIVYTQREENLNLNKEDNITIDLGVNNLASITSNKQGFQPLLVNGRVLKSINQFYNKTKSKMQKDILPKKQEFSKAMETLTTKRNRKIKHYMHNVSKMIIQLCKDNDIGTIIIGKNDFWKQESNMGKKNNQNFVSIPFNVLIEQLKYKGGLVGITVLYVEESYTSKCSFLDEEEMCHHEKYLGRRIKRGLFKSSSKKLINADTNGSYNIMRKVFPNFYKEYGIEGFVVSPSFCTPCRA